MIYVPETINSIRYHFVIGDEAAEIRHHTSSWPVGLGIAEQDDGQSGLAPAFGWQSAPGFASSLIEHFKNFYIVSRENDVLDILGENFGPRTFGNSQVIGHNGLDIQARPANWMDLRIDSPELQTWMREQRGIEISGDRPDNVWDHWYYYTYRGNMGLYRRILREPGQWELNALRTNDPPIPDGVAFGWSIFGD